MTAQTTSIVDRFESTFEALAEDGEKVRDQARESLQKFGDRVVKRVKATRKEVTKRAESAVQTVLDYSPVASTDDLKKLERKLNRALTQIAK